MAYADRVTDDISVRAHKWYDAVRDSVLMHEDGEDRVKLLEELFTDMEAAVIQAYYGAGCHPMVSSDMFHWALARAVWESVHGPLQPLERENHGLLVDRVFPVHVRDKIAKKVRTRPIEAIDGCEPLAFPLPETRRFHLYLGDKENIKKTITEAASILGPEFSLSCSFGGNQRTIVTFGLAPGVDVNNESVLWRASYPIDWLEDWWVNVIEGNYTHLVSHLRSLASERHVHAWNDLTDRITATQDTIQRREETGAYMTEEEIRMAFEAQQHKIDRLAEGIARQTVVAARRKIFNEPEQGMGHTGRIDSFIRHGSVEAPFVDDVPTRLKAVQDARSAMTAEVDGLLDQWQEHLQRDE
ncbi:hypothetical protein PG997_007129 [Apiospora hydei]|uniref:Uncharacterized protein n=1 Tax=Apiospora hydei TaxID=1337664 RepID=A0ABR1WQP4_9PEZI